MLGWISRRLADAAYSLPLSSSWRVSSAQPVHNAPDTAAVLDDGDHGGELLLDVGEFLAVARG